MDDRSVFIATLKSLSASEVGEGSAVGRLGRLRLPLLLEVELELPDLALLAAAHAKWGGAYAKMMHSPRMMAMRKRSMPVQMVLAMGALTASCISSTRKIFS
jgi:hypothetical protein